MIDNWKSDRLAASIIILVALFWGTMLPFRAAASNDAATSGADYIKYQSEGNYFSVLIPQGWDKSEKNHPYGDLTEIHGVKLTGPKNKDGAAVTISIRYYAGEGLFKTADQYIKSELNSMVRLDYDEKTEIAAITLAGLPARAFRINAFELIYLPSFNVRPPKEDNIVYERIAPSRKVTIIRQFIVMTALRGFYVLNYNAPEDVVEQYAAVFSQVTKSFLPLLKKGKESNE